MTYSVRASLAREASLDQIAQPRKALKAAVNRVFAPVLQAGRRAGIPLGGLPRGSRASGEGWRLGLDLNQDKERCTAPASTRSATEPSRSLPITGR